MKVKLDPLLNAHRGEPVEIGNVYACNRAPAFRDFRIVVGKASNKASGRTPWNNIILLHIDADGDVVGCSRQPPRYMSEHWDLVGKVEDMPSLKIKWMHNARRG